MENGLPQPFPAADEQASKRDIYRENATFLVKSPISPGHMVSLTVYPSLLEWCINRTCVWPNARGWSE
jgi:hypothetical protein